jgi:hypothetical protein
MKTEKEIIEYFKGKNIIDADKLLMDTARNNFNAGYKKAKKENEKVLAEIRDELKEGLGDLDYSEQTTSEYNDKVTDLIDKIFSAKIGGRLE